MDESQNSYNAHAFWKFGILHNPQIEKPKACFAYLASGKLNKDCKQHWMWLASKYIIKQVTMRESE